MSEYQRYEFMTIDRPLTRSQLDEVDNLSSHIEASSTHAFIEYNWGDFKHDPIKVLHKYFDGFLYWANWGSPQFALRFPHGVLPDNLLRNYDCGENVTFTQHSDYDILEFSFGELEAPDEWMEYELADLISIREELMNDDLRSLYIGWLASQDILYNYYDGDDEDTEDWEDDEDEDKDENSKEKDEELRDTPEVPPAFKTLTAAQRVLANLLQVPPELLMAAALHSSDSAKQTTDDDFVAWVELLPQERRSDYLVRLARNEPGLHLRLVKELRAAGQPNTTATATTTAAIPYATLLAESKDIKATYERNKREQEQRARHQRLQKIQEHQSNHWFQADQAALRKNSSGYDEATRVLEELREAAQYFNQTDEFQQRFHSWLLPHLRRPALIQRLKARKFPFPEA
ncbi:hypothetical protein [Dictyobacter formicarum]|uniref:Knr4/Smi1-like domain-containing protein n=1 Tax=Dictyobacter formicarum TaxID=2778368 RepID=A0ABQ3VD69_9CHLR|nr:hypothetical protein [Dictyobacter formicarum]GHO84029.1 hypothetical protein KSZ_20350 [Dictyobacter formicarum]